MKDFNNWQGTGRLGQDVQSPQGNGPAKFSIAVTDSVKKGEQWEDETSWIDIIYWHKSILPFLTKGREIGIQGKLKQEKWTDKDTGQSRSKLIVVAQDIKLFGESRKEGQGSTQNQSGVSSAGQAPIAGARKQDSVPKASPGVLNNDDFSDDIPF